MLTVTSFFFLSASSVSSAVNQQLTDQYRRRSESLSRQNPIDILFDSGKHPLNLGKSLPQRPSALMNESIQQKVERAVGNQFVRWLNRANGSEFQFERNGADPPDLVYRAGEKMLPVEITTSYYHEEDAIMLWNARKDPTAPAKWRKPLDQPDRRLIADINERISKKCLGTHDVGTVLVIEIYPAITTKNEFETLKSGIAIPKTIPFAAIYVAGTFPAGSDGMGGYFCWEVS